MATWALSFSVVVSGRERYRDHAEIGQFASCSSGNRWPPTEVPYGDRNALAELTGGYVYVPVLVHDDGTVVTESRAICERLLAGGNAEHLCPPAWAGPIWAYHDFVDGPLEDVLFRIASPAIRDAWTTAWERAL